MASDASDILMKLQLQNWQHMPGESQADFSQIKSKGGMARAFLKNFMFELSSFSLKIGTSGGEDVESARTLANSNMSKLVDYNFRKELYDKVKKRQGPDFDLEPPPEPEYDTATSVGQYQRFREGGGGKYPVDMKPIEIKKSIDKASMLLLDYCIKRTVFKTATIIKRKAAGTASSGEVYLRYDFDTVLFTEAGMSDGDDEKFKFICRAVTMSYRAQKDDGTLDAAVQGFWKTPLSKATAYDLQA